jgi:hypothetical protein
MVDGCLIQLDLRVLSERRLTGYVSYDVADRK